MSVESESKLEQFELPIASIIIVNYNGKHYLEECFNSIYGLDYPRDKLELILVDNASIDGSCEYVKKTFPNVRILQLDKNYGFCKPNNEGVKIARGQYVALLNNDTVVDKEWLLELIKGALNDKDVVSCGSKIFFLERKNLINSAGGKIAINGGGFYNGYGDEDCEKYNKFGYTGFGCGAGVLVKKDFFDEIGGFDEDYFAACEENDLGWKSWLFGYKVLFVPTAVMYHRLSGTFGSKSGFQPIKVYLITRNRLYNLFKNLEFTNVIKGLLVSIIFDIYRAIRHLFSRNFAATKSIINAYIDFIQNYRKTIEKRKIIQANRKRSDKELYELGVIATLKECIFEEKRLSKLQNNFLNMGRLHENPNL